MHRLSGLLASSMAFLLLAQAPVLAAADGCRQGFVWREAFQGDHVCVTPDVRAQARSDNSQAAGRVNPTNHDYGPDTCRYGYVWREASSTDHVCVIPEVRAQAARDNAAAAGRLANAPGPDYAGRGPRSSPSGSYNPAWQAAPGDTSCCPNNMLVCPLGRHFCRS